MKSRIAIQAGAGKTGRTGVLRGAHLRPFVLLALLCLGFASLPGAAAEPSGRMRIEVPPASAAENRLETARRQIERERWDLAIPLLQRIMEQEEDTLIWTGEAYEPASRVAARLLARLPRQARRTYSMLYEPEAARRLAEGVRERSTSILGRTARLYLNTPSGLRAVGALADLLMDEGRFDLALRALAATDSLPLSPEQERLLLPRRLTCLARLGMHSRAREVLQEAEDRGITTVTVARQDVPLAEFAERILSRYPPTPPPPSIRPDLLHSLRFEVLALTDGALPHAAATDDTIIVNSAGDLTALDMRRLSTLWTLPTKASVRRLAASLLPDHDGEVLPLWMPLGDRRFWHEVVNQGTSMLTAAQDRFLTVQVDFAAFQLPEEPWTARPHEVHLPNELRCYHAGSGRLLWRAGGPRGAVLPGFWFVTAPAVSRGRVYVLGAREGELWALCLELDSGQELWRSRIGPIESRQVAQRYIMEFYLADACPPVVADGVAVYPTGQGVVAGFDARDGRPLWLTPYRRSDRLISRLGKTLSVPSSAWRLTRPIAVNGHVVYAPLDSREVVSVDLEKGTLRWSTAFDDGLSLLGVHDGLALVQRYSGLSALELATGEAAWEWRSRQAPSGRGAVLDGVIYLPHHDGVRTREARTGRAGPTHRWPAWVGERGDLTVLDGRLAILSGDRLTLCLDPEASPPGDAEPARGAFLEAVRSFREGDMEAAARRLEALGQASRPVREQAAALLGEVAIETGQRHLLELALRFSPDEPTLRATLAEAEFRFLLRRADPDQVAAAYLERLTSRGAEPASTPRGRESLWLRLYAALAAEAASSPETSRQLQDAFEAKVGAALAGEDAETLAAAAHHAPYPRVRERAMLALAELREASGRRDVARRAFEALALWSDEPATRAEGSAALEKMQTPLPPRKPPVHEPLPQQAKEHWSADGLLVLPSFGAAFPQEVLVVDRQGLRRLDASDGRELHSIALPPPPETQVPARVDPGSGHVSGPGCPTYLAGGDRLTLGLPPYVLSLDAGSNEIQWKQAAQTPLTQYAARPHIRREHYIERALRGLPLPRGRLPSFIIRLDDFRLGPLAACRIEANHAVSVMDRLSGEEFFRLDGSGAGRLTGVLAAIDGPLLWLALPEVEEVLAVSLVDGRLLARWRFDASLPLRGLLVREPGRVALGVLDGIYEFNLYGAPSRRWTRLSRGVEHLLYADEDAVVAQSLEGEVLVVPGEPEQPVRVLPPAADGKTAWAEVREGVLFLLEVEGFRMHIPHGPAVHFRCDGWLLRAMRLRDGAELWKHQSPAGDNLVVGPPVARADGFLLAYHTEEEVVLVGLQALDGHERLRVELPAAGRPAAVPLLLTDESIIVGVGDRVMALSAETGSRTER